MIILGIDPGTGRTGWGAIRKLKVNPSALLRARSEKLKVENKIEFEYIAHGCITTDQNQSMPERLLVLYKSLDKIIKEFEPECIIIELIFFGKNTKTAISVGQARGVAMVVSAKHSIPVYEYTGISVKYNLSGFGRSDKKDMQKIVRRILNTNKRRLPFNSKDKGFDDAADALAIAIHHALKSI